MDVKTVQRIVDATIWGPGHPFKQAVAELLAEHERRLGILSGHIIPERCNPHPEEPQAKATETDVADEKWEWDEGLVSTSPCEAKYDGLSQEIPRHAITGEPYDQEPGNFHEELAAASLDELERVKVLWKQAEDGERRALQQEQDQLIERERAEAEVALLRRELQGVNVERGRWSAERGRLMAARDRYWRALREKHTPVPEDDLTAAYMAGAASRRNKGEEESKGEGGCSTGTAQEPGAPASPTGAGDREASSPAAPSLSKEVMAILDAWAVGIGSPCGDAASEVLDSWEAQHRKLRKAARAMCEEAPHQVRLLRENDWDGHADGLESAADCLEAALKEDSDATPLDQDAGRREQVSGIEEMLTRRYRQLLAVAEAAAKTCWVDTCPGCQEMWECAPKCTYSFFHPASAEAVRANRNRFAPLRAALMAAGYEVET